MKKRSRRRVTQAIEARKRVYPIRSLIIMHLDQTPCARQDFSRIEGN